MDVAASCSESWSWRSTGMPRPSSSTVTEPSLLIVTLTVRGVAGHRLVDRVVDDFVDQVVQAADGRVADVHAGPFADVLQIAEMLEILRGVVGVAGLRVGGLLFGGDFGFSSDMSSVCVAVFSQDAEATERMIGELKLLAMQAFNRHLFLCLPVDLLLDASALVNSVVRFSIESPDLPTRKRRSRILASGELAACSSARMRCFLER